MYLTYFKGSWSEGNTPLFGAMDNAVWLGSSVFDGARSIRGHVPDLRLHLARVLKSALSLGLQCPYKLDEMEALEEELTQLEAAGDHRTHLAPRGSGSKSFHIHARHRPRQQMNVPEPDEMRIVLVMGNPMDARQQE